MLRRVKMLIKLTKKCNYKKKLIIECVSIMHS